MSDASLPPYIEVPGLALPLSDSNHIGGDTARRPDIVELHASRHDADQHLVGLEVGHRHLLDLEGATLVARS